MSWSFEKNFEPAGAAFEGIAKLITEHQLYKKEGEDKKALTAILMLAQAAARDHGDKKSLYVSASGHINDNGSGDYSVRITIGAPNVTQ